MSKTILVTGASGFIGSHVSQALLARGDTVVGIDNFNSYYDPARKEANLREITCSAADRDRFTLVRGDIRDQALVQQIFTNQPISAVVHLAAMAGVRASIENPQLYHEVNLMATLNLLSETTRRGCGNFVFASTSSVYGDTQEIPFQETNPCDRPLAPYAASKRAAELLGFTFHHLHGLNFTALRFFTVYGPRNRPDMMAYKVADNICFGRQVPLFNNGQMYRDWTYIGDIVQGITAAVDRPLGYEIINLGRGEPIRLADFVGLIEELSGHKACLTSAPMPDADVPYTFADIAKARRLLDYDPQVSVREGVANFWEWYQQAVLGSSRVPPAVA